MPELPEVETTRLALAPHLLGQPLQRVSIGAPKLRQATPNPELLQGRTVNALTRRAKYMLAELDDGYTLLIHLGMSGRFRIYPTDGRDAPEMRFTYYLGAPVAKHDHASFTTPSAELRYNDPRRFGLLLRIPTPTLMQHPLLANLGPEPLSPGFTPQSLHAALHGKTSAIKPTLMNPTVVVGVGNIYASESLFAARIHPAQPANTLSLNHCQALHRAVVAVLNRALDLGGSTLRDYKQPTGEAGHFQDEFKVYGRAGQPCPSCSTVILQSIQAQRRTFWCPTCQHQIKALSNKKARHV